MPCDPRSYAPFAVVSTVVSVLTMSLDPEGARCRRARTCRLSDVPGTRWPEHPGGSLSTDDDTECIGCPIAFPPSFFFTEPMDWARRRSMPITITGRGRSRALATPFTWFTTSAPGRRSLWACGR